MQRAKKPPSRINQAGKLLDLGTVGGGEGGGRDLLASQVLNLRLQKEEIITTITTLLQPQHFAPVEASEKVLTGTADKARAL